MTTGSSGPLAHIRVLDLGTVLAGPFAATLLGDFGAEVIKIELPGRGDALRHLGPVQAGTSLWFAADARNKRSITLDLRTAQGRELLLQLAAVSDVLVENFTPGTLDKWGLGSDAFTASNPRLIISRASGYGQTGPYRERPGYDRVGLAFGGLWQITGKADGEPMRAGASIADYLTGTFSALGILIALYHRDLLSGQGQEVDASLFESVFRVMEFTAIQHGLDGTIRRRSGNAGPVVPSGAFQTRGGRWIAVVVGEDRMFERLMLAVERPDLGADARYRTAPDRAADREPLETAIRDWVIKHDLSETQAVFQAAEIPAAVDLTIEEIFADPHYAARDAIVEVQDPSLGTIQMQGVTPRLSSTPGSVRTGAPALGQDNDAIFGDLLGLPAATMAELRAGRII